MALSVMITLVFWALVGLAVAAPTSTASVSTCTTPRIRKEWRALTVPERKEYIRAVQCMLDSPPKTKATFRIVANRYEDFVAMHANATGGGIKLETRKGGMSDWTEMRAHMQHGIHQTGVFVPWHRYAVWLYEEALRNECGYTGMQPYWDWHKDTPEANNTWSKSPVFDPDTGFGGNGKYNETINNPAPKWGFGPMGGSGGGCVMNGPFEKVKLHIGPMGVMTNNTRCLTRNFNEGMVHAAASKESIARVLKATSFTDFRNWAEQPPIDWKAGMQMFNMSRMGNLHTIGHSGIGGEMMDMFNSLNDPIFWLHHAGLDRIWSIWQDEDPKRLFDVGRPAEWYEIQPALKLDTPLWVGLQGPDRPVESIMDTVNKDGRGFLCYRYEGTDAKFYVS